MPQMNYLTTQTITSAILVFLLDVKEKHYFIKIHENLNGMSLFCCTFVHKKMLSCTLRP